MIGSPGCCCNPIKLTALGCPGDAVLGQWTLPNAPVTITNLAGEKVASGNTDGNGVFSFAGAQGGEYVCTITAQRFNKFVQTFKPALFGPTYMNVCRGAGPAPGYACCTQFAYPLKTTLQYTDKNGTRPLQFVPGGGGPGGNCAVGYWQLCYNAPATVPDAPNGDAGLTCCSNARAGETLVAVGYCPIPGLSYPIVGCGPWDWVGGWSACANAAAGASFYPQDINSCYTSTEPATLDCVTMLFWPSCDGARGRIDQNDTFAPLGNWAVSLSPPDGFAGSGRWVDYGCNPVAGPYTITE